MVLQTGAQLIYIYIYINDNVTVNQCYNPNIILFRQIFAHILLLTAFDKFNHSMLFPNIYIFLIYNHKPTFGPKLAR